RFPPTFISAGNADPLLPQSQALAERLTALGVAVDRLFFPANYEPELPHEYQFDLETPASRLALARSLEFLARATDGRAAADCSVSEPAGNPLRRAVLPLES